MRTNIDIDDSLMARALEAGPYKTKREAVEAGLELIARRAAYREVLKWRGKLKWEGDERTDWQAAALSEALTVRDKTADCTVTKPITQSLKKPAKASASVATTKAARARR